MTISILFGGTGAMFCSEIISVAKFYRKINYLKYSDPTLTARKQIIQKLYEHFNKNQ
jgi:hypothetical protein